MERTGQECFDASNDPTNLMTPPHQAACGWPPLAPSPFSLQWFTYEDTVYRATFENIIPQVLVRGTEPSNAMHRHESTQGGASHFFCSGHWLRRVLTLHWTLHWTLHIEASGANQCCFTGMSNERTCQQRLGPSAQALKLKLLPRSGHPSPCTATRNVASCSCKPS